MGSLGSLVNPAVRTALIATLSSNASSHPLPSPPLAPHEALAQALQARRTSSDIGKGGAYPLMCVQSCMSPIYDHESRLFVDDVSCHTHTWQSPTASLQQRPRRRRCWVDSGSAFSSARRGWCVQSFLSVCQRNHAEFMGLLTRTVDFQPQINVCSGRESCGMLLSPLKH